MANQIKKKYLVPEIFTEIESDIAVAVAAEETRAEAAEDVLQGNIDAEEARALAAEGVLQGNINTEKARAEAAEAALGVRIDDMLSNVDPAALDSFTEVVAAFEAADGNLETSITNLTTDAAAARAAIQADVDQNEADGDAAILAEETARIAADAAATADRAAIRSEFSNFLDLDSGNWDSYLSDNEFDHLLAVFENIDVVAATIQASLAQEVSDRVTAVAAEETRAEAAEGVLQGNIDTEETARIAADAAATADRDAIRSEFAAADAALKGDAGEGYNTLGKLEDKIQAEEAARSAAINTLNGDSSVEGSVAKAIADVIDMAPEALNTLNELAASIGDDADFAGSVTQQITDAKNELKGSVSEAFDTMKEIEDEFTKLNGDSSVVDSVDYKVAAEETARIAADAAATADRAAIRSEFAAADSALKGDAGEGYNTLGKLEDKIQAEEATRSAIDADLQAQIVYERGRIDNLDTGFVSEAEFALETAKIGVLEGEMDAAEGRISTLEALAFYKESAVVDASNVFELQNAPMANSLSVFVGRLALIEGVDYSVSGSTVTIIGELAFGSGDDEELVAGENVYFQYYK